MFLSRVEIPWEAARNAYDIHRQLWRLFPGQAREARSNGEEVRQGFLFRVEEHQPGQTARLLLQSRREPVPTTGVSVVGTREFCPQPAAGQRLAFLLTANPVKTITDAERENKPGKKSDKCRVPLIREEEQLQWLKRKFIGVAEIEVATVLPHAPLYFRKGNRGGKLLTATFDGVMRVQEPAALVSLQESGIGHAKAFGCGLLLVRRV